MHASECLLQLKVFFSQNTHEEITRKCEAYIPSAMIKVQYNQTLPNRLLRGNKN